MSRKTTHKKRAYRQWIRKMLIEGNDFDANGNTYRPRLTGDGRGMAEQHIAGAKIGQYARKRY